MKTFTKAKLLTNTLSLFILASAVCHALPNLSKSFAEALAEARKDKKVLGIYFDKPESDACLALKLEIDWNRTIRIID